MSIDPRIFYLLVVPDGHPRQATPLQGFAPSLCRAEWLIRSFATLPSTIDDLSNKGRQTFIQRRVVGSQPIHWHGQSPRAILTSTPPTEAPFFMVFLTEGLPVAEYMQWSANHGNIPSIVAVNGGHLSYEQLNLEGIKARFLAVCDLLGPNVVAEEAADAKRLIGEWQELEERDLDYKVGGHNSVAPNVAVLRSMGFGDIWSGPMPVATHIQPHVDQIVRTTRSIFQERERLEVQRLARYFKPTFDLNLFAPAIYPDVLNMNVPTTLDREERNRFIVARRMLENQTGYSYNSSTAAHATAILGLRPGDTQGASPTIAPHPLFRLRADELWLGTAAMTVFAVSEASAVARLPNQVNRTSGIVHNFAEHYRGNTPAPRKRLRSFQEVQNSLARAVPNEFVDLIRASQSGIRIVADAHLEWLNVDGLPLGIRKDVTRIPVTPGNSFLDYLSAAPPLQLTPRDFENVLVISAMGEDDEPLRGLMPRVIEGFERGWDERINVNYVEVATEEEFIAALNNHDGALAIFDGHGGHERGQPGRLFLKGTPVDVWTLGGRLNKVPPIIVLSACDTHAADRNHATAANGFLSLGARTVLGSVFPLNGLEAAIFIGRLLLRIALFLPAEIGRRRRPITWAELVSGMLRMLLLTDYLMHLFASGLITEQTYMAVHEQGNIWINTPEPDSFERVDQLLMEQGLDRNRLQSERDVAIANSSFISYLQIGRPETISFVTAELLEELNPREITTP